MNMRRIILVSLIFSFFGITQTQAQSCQSCFTYAPDVSNSNLINLDATCSSITGHVNYEWFVDGQPYFGFPFPYFQIPFSLPGTYTITLVVDNGICSDSSSQTVNILPSCNASFTAYPIGLNSFYFYPAGNISPTTTFAWDFGDGTTGSLGYEQHTYQNPGTYTVCLVFTDTVLGGCSDTSCQTLTVTNTFQCIANLNYYLDPISGYLNASASGSSYNPSNYGFTWTLNGQVVQQGPSDTYATILPNTGSYVLGLYVTDNANNPCDSMFQIVNYVSLGQTGCVPCFTTSYNSTYDSIFVNSSCSQIPSGGGFYWMVDGQLLSTTASSFLQGFTTPGSHTISLFVTDSTNQICDSLVQYVYIYPPACTSCLTITPVAGSTSDYVFDGSCSTVGTNYTWFVDGVYVFAGNSPQFTYSFTQSGTYTVCLQTSDLVNGVCNAACSTLVVNTPTATTYDLAGRIYKVDNLFNYSTAGNGEAKVYLIKLITGGTLDAIDSTTTDANGYYVFNNKPIDDYRIKVALNPTSPDYAYNVPTYYNYSLMWYDAQVITLFNNTYSKDVYMQYGVNAGGNGFISGSVFQGANKMRSAADVTLILMNTSNNQAVAYAKPDANGNYSFSGIGYGTYKIYGELLNRASIPDEINITSSQINFTNRNFKYTSTAIAPTSEVLSVTDKIAEDEVRLLPNPARDQFTLVNDGSAKEVNVYDLTGRLMSTLAVKANEKLQVNCSDWVKGIYTLSIRSNNATLTKKLVVQ
jgi:PKD repeat protein